MLLLLLSMLNFVSPGRESLQHHQNIPYAVERECFPGEDTQVHKTRRYVCPSGTFLLPAVNTQERYKPICRWYAKECNFHACMRQFEESPICSKKQARFPCKYQVGRIYTFRVNEVGTSHWHELEHEEDFVEVERTGDGRLCWQVEAPQDYSGKILKISLECQEKTDPSTEECILVKLEGVDHGLLVTHTVSAIGGTKKKFRDHSNKHENRLTPRIFLKNDSKSLHETGAFKIPPTSAQVENKGTADTVMSHQTTTPSTPPANAGSKNWASSHEMTIFSIVAAVLMIIFFFIFALYMKYWGFEEDEEEERNQKIELIAASFASVGSFYRHPPVTGKPVQLDQDPYEYLTSSKAEPSEQPVYSAVFHDRKKDLEDTPRAMPTNVLATVDADARHVYELVGQPRISREVPPMDSFPLNSMSNEMTVDSDDPPYELVGGAKAMTRRRTVDSASDSDTDNVFSTDTRFQQSSSKRRSTNTYKLPTPLTSPLHDFGFGFGNDETYNGYDVRPMLPLPVDDEVDDNYSCVTNAGFDRSTDTFASEYNSSFAVTDSGADTTFDEFEGGLQQNAIEPLDQAGRQVPDQARGSFAEPVRDDVSEENTQL